MSISVYTSVKLTNVTCWNSQWEWFRGMRSAPPSPKIPIWDGATNLGVPRLKLPLFSCLRSFVPVVQPNLELLPQKCHCSLSIVTLFDPYYCGGFLSFGTGRRYFNQLRSDSVGSHLLLLHCSNQWPPILVPLF